MESGIDNDLPLTERLIAPDKHKTTSNSYVYIGMEQVIRE